MAQGVRTPYPDGLLRVEEVGRPTHCTPKVIADAAALVRCGMYPTVALEHAGVSARCHSLWVQHALEDIDHQDDSIYVQYSRAIKQAESEAELEMVSRVREAANSGPQYWPAGMTYLERRHPDRWGKRERQEAPTHATQVNIVFAPFPGAQAPLVSAPQALDRAELTEPDTDDLGHTPPRICAPADTPP